MLITAPALAGETTMARGNITLRIDKPATVTLTHAYYFSGPDRFDKKSTIRSIVFTTQDKRAAFDACTDTRCASLASSDGLKVDLVEPQMTQWWAHIGASQSSGPDSGDALTLSVETPERIAGTFKLENSMVSALVVFDVSLIRSFDK